MPQGDDQASEMIKALKHGENTVISDMDATEILQPGVGAFDFPAFPIAAQLAFVLKAAATDVFSVGTCNSVSRLRKRIRKASES
jgi:hypothetical protein